MTTPSYTPIIRLPEKTDVNQNDVMLVSIPASTKAYKLGIGSFKDSIISDFNIDVINTGGVEVGKRTNTYTLPAFTNELHRPNEMYIYAVYPSPHPEYSYLKPGAQVKAKIAGGPFRDYHISHVHFVPAPAPVLSKWVLSVTPGYTADLMPAHVALEVKVRPRDEGSYVCFNEGQGIATTTQDEVGLSLPYERSVISYSPHGPNSGFVCNSVRPIPYGEKKSHELYTAIDTAKITNSLGVLKEPPFQAGLIECEEVRESPLATQPSIFCNNKLYATDQGYINSTKGALALVIGTSARDFPVVKQQQAVYMDGYFISPLGSPGLIYCSTDPDTVFVPKSINKEGAIECSGLKITVYNRASMYVFRATIKVWNRQAPDADVLPKGMYLIFNIIVGEYSLPTYTVKYRSFPLEFTRGTKHEEGQLRAFMQFEIEQLLYIPTITKVYFNYRLLNYVQYFAVQLVEDQTGYTEDMPSDCRFSLHSLISKDVV